MAVLTVAQATQDAQQAGFRGAAVSTIVAIAMAESGLNTLAYNGQDPAGGSFGILQINGVHTDISTYAKYDAQASFDYAYKLSNGGTNFAPWSTFTSGRYKQFLGQAGGAVTTTNSSSGDIPGWQQIINQLVSQIPGVGGSLVTAGQVNDALSTTPGGTPGAIASSATQLPIVGGVLQFAIGSAERIGFFILALAIILIGIIFVVWEPAAKTLKEAAPLALKAT